jgi:hypothetical protein
LQYLYANTGTMLYSILYIFSNLSYTVILPYDAI